MTLYIQKTEYTLLVQCNKRLAKQPNTHEVRTVPMKIPLGNKQYNVTSK